MIDFRQWLACPGCGAPLSADWICASCGARFEAPDGIPNLRLDGDARTEAVRRFYESTPFPGYPPGDTLFGLCARAERSRFAQLCDRAIAADARIAEIGCGTGQMSLYLARADRVIVATDLSRASLALGSAAARRYGIENVQFVETNLQRLALKSGAFDVVYSSGVLHHTPHPEAAFASIVQCVRPGGLLIVGLYNAVARIPLRIRRAIARLTGFRVIPFDPVLCERRLEPARREAWLRDQYQHPEEHRHTVAETKRWFADNGVEYLRSFPSVVLGDDGAELFAPAIDDWAVERWIAQVEWMWTLGREGGLFFTIGRRRSIDAASPEEAQTHERPSHRDSGERSNASL